jgi:hypothetical protein
MNGVARMMFANPVRHWIHHRAHATALGHDHVHGQRRLALYLAVFAAVRVACWVSCMLIIIAHWLGAGGSFIHAFTDLSSSVLFVTFISFYCNSSSDAANLTAGLAALFAADSHGAAETNRLLLQLDTASIEEDIARLASLQPGEEAEELSQAIRRKMNKDAPR